MRRWLIGSVRPVLLLTLLLLSFSASAETENGQVDCEQLHQFTFSWPFVESCDMQPRGGSTRGASVTVDPEPHPGWLAIQEEGLSDFERDRRAILAMAGPYRTSFDFLEIIGFQNDFKPDAPYQSWGTEYVYVVEDRGDFISLQHIMVMVFEDEKGNSSEPVIMKHWRQDWHYEKDDILVYTGNGRFEHREFDDDAVEGHWAQAVYQVDDSPRYEGIGEWKHYPNFSTWESNETWRPLPRRESSVRDDYQVLIGSNRHTIVPHGWIHEQGNLKTVIDDEGEPSGEAPYLSKELGVNRYRRIVDFDFSPADHYWEATADYWQDVREAWDELIEDKEAFVLKKTVNDVPLFAALFAYAQKLEEGETYPEDEAEDFITETLDRYTE